MTTYDDDKLLAFANAELDDAEMDAIEAAITADPDIAARVEAIMMAPNKVDQLVKAAFPASGKTAVPPELDIKVKAMLGDQPTEASKVAELLPFSAQTPKAKLTAANSNNRNWFAAMAASVALVVGGLVGYSLPHNDGSSTPGIGEIALAGAPSERIDAALANVISGDEQTFSETGDRFRAIASFRDGDGDLCREFELDTSSNQSFVSVACKTGDEWMINFAVAAGINDEGYAPASSLDALGAYLDAIGAGATLNEDDERRALEALK